MSVSDEQLMAYADGELDPAARAAVEEAIAGDPALAARVAQHRALRARLQSVHAPLLSAVPPERLLRAARGQESAGSEQRHSATVARLRSARHAVRPLSRWAALAASILGAAALGWIMLRGPLSGPLLSRNGALFAGGPLARALEQQLASTQPPGSKAQIGISFVATSGEYCRTFSWHEAAALAGLACRGPDGWRVQVITELARDPAASQAYRTAASALPPAVLEAVQRRISGEPLDADGERAARLRGWRGRPD